MFYNLCFGRYTSGLLFIWLFSTHPFISCSLSFALFPFILSHSLLLLFSFPSPLPLLFYISSALPLPSLFLFVSLSSYPLPVLSLIFYLVLSPSLFLFVSLSSSFFFLLHVLCLHPVLSIPIFSRSFNFSLSILSPPLFVPTHSLDPCLWGSPIIAHLVHQPAYLSIWSAAPSLPRGLSTNPGVTVWCLCGCS